MKTSYLFTAAAPVLAATLFGATPAARADKPAAATAGGALTMEPSLYAWLFRIDSPDAGGPEWRDSTGRPSSARWRDPYDREVSDSFVRHGLSRDASAPPDAGPAWPRPVLTADAPASRTVEPMVAAPFDFSVRVLAPAASQRPTVVDFTGSPAGASSNGAFAPAAGFAGFRSAAESAPLAAFAVGPRAAFPLTGSYGTSTPAAASARSSDVPASVAPAVAFTDLGATAPVQAHPAPLLIDPQRDALPAGQTLYISELNGIVSSATGNGGTVSTFKTLGTNELFGIGAFGGSIYVVDGTANVVDRIVISTGAVSTFASLGGTNNGPTALTIDPGGNIYVALRSANTISKITPGGVVSTFATLPAGAQAYGLALAPNGNFYSANEGTRSISQITPGGVVSTFATFPSGTYSASLVLGGLAIDKNGNLFVSDQDTTTNAAGNIYKVTTGGVISLFAAVGANSEPIGLAFDANGVLYTANASSISQITPGGVVSSFATDGNGPDYLVIVPEPATYLGGALLLGVAVIGARRQFRRARSA